MKHIAALLIVFFAAFTPAIAQEADAGDPGPLATLEAVAPAATVAPVVVDETPIEAPAADNAETLAFIKELLQQFGIVVLFYLVYRSVPASALDKFEQKAREGAAKTDTPIDDALVELLTLVRKMVPETAPAPAEPDDPAPVPGDSTLLIR